MGKDTVEVAIIEFGDCPLYKGLYITKSWEALYYNTSTCLYYYPENITLEEAKQEIKDLEEFYDGLGIAVPVPKHLEELVK